MASIDNLLVSLFVDEVVGGFIVTIPPGHVGCIYSIFRGVIKNVWYPGMHFKIPVIHRVKLFNAQLIEYTISKDVILKDDGKEVMGDEVINAVTADNKFVTVEATVLIKLDTERLPEIWQNIGENFVSKVVRPVTRSRIRKVITNYELSKALSIDRTKIEDEIKEELQTSLATHGLHVDNFYLSSLTPVDGKVAEEKVVKVKKEVKMPKSKEEIEESRTISGNVPKQRTA